ncbi:MAG: O-antigen ligase family protein [Geminicoccaceae bacterium]
MYAPAAPVAPSVPWRQIVAALLACTIIALAWTALPNPIIALPLAVLPIAGLVCVRQPVFVVLLFASFSLFRLHEAVRVLYPLHIPQLLALGAILTLVLHLKTERVRPYWTPALTVFAVFFGLVTLQTPLALNRAYAMGMWSGNFSKIGIMVLAIAWLIREPRQLGLAFRMFAVAGLVVAGVAISNKLNGIGLVEGTRVTIARDLRSQLGDPNDLSLVLLFPASFALALILGRGINVLDRALGFVTFCAVFTGIIFTQSRGGLLGIMAVLGVFAWNRVRNKFLLLGAGAVVAMGLFVMAGVADRQVVANSEGAIDESSQTRLYAWQAAFNMACSRPLTGVGMDNFYANFFYYSPNWDGKNHAVHSTWFQIMAETGFIGFAVFITFIATTIGLGIRGFRRAREGMRRSPTPSLTRLTASMEGLIAGVLGFCTSGTFLTQGFSWPLYISFALIVATERMISRELDETLKTA